MLAINKFQYDWNNLTIIGLNIVLDQVTKIDFTVNQDMNPNYGRGSEPQTYSYGRVNYSGSMEMYLSQWNTIIKASPSMDPMQIPPFDLSISYGLHNGHGVEAYQTIIHDVQFMGHNKSFSEGETGYKITIPFMMSGIEHYRR